MKNRQILLNASNIPEINDTCNDISSHILRQIEIRSGSSQNHSRCSWQSYRQKRRIQGHFPNSGEKGPKVRFHPGIPGREGYTDGKNNSRRIVAAGRQCRSAALPPCGKEGKRKGIRKHSVHAEGEGEGPFAGAVPGREDRPGPGHVGLPGRDGKQEP